MSVHKRQHTGSYPFPFMFQTSQQYGYPVDFQKKRIRILKSKEFLQSLDDEDDHVFATNIIDLYAARPLQLSAMCLALFAMWYKVKGSTTNDDFFPPNTDLQNPDTTVASENLHASHTNIQFNDTLNIPQSHVDANHYPAIADEQRDGNDSQTNYKKGLTTKILKKS
ncbi:hypothetical protein DPMN_074884 [Dreissena polymorpha]|uniref:Uncharacterized protein n=1 Tax=Dreissena polymorpha TaxID=45954 RepID=A0A9D3YFT7_DREPO|nr:hypothetical protein DPMN_074884 [Dreissena polymorpha]